MPPLSSSKWPKPLAPLTPEQQERNNSFLKIWHEELAGRSRYGMIEKFNHLFPVKHSQVDFLTTLEIGAGLGEHLEYEKLTTEQAENYHCLEFRENMAEEIRRRFPKVNVQVGDCQARGVFPDGHFDRMIAIHVLEHLPHLPAAIREAHRVLNKSTGRMLVVIPAEGSLAYSLARKLSAERVWKRHFTAPYSEFYTREHINLPHEILAELAPFFSVESRSHFPLGLPLMFCTLCIGLELRPRSRV